MTDEQAHYARWQDHVRRAHPGQGDAFDTFGIDLVDHASHQRSRWVEGDGARFDEAHCRACVQTLWKLASQYEHWPLVSALPNFPLYMAHQSRGLSPGEARFLLELLVTPEIDAFIRLTSRQEREAKRSQWLEHVEVALERCARPWAKEALEAHLLRFFRTLEPPNALGYRNEHKIMCRAASCVMSWVRHAYGLEIALELCFVVMRDEWLGWGLWQVGDTIGEEARAIALMHERGVDLDAIVPEYPEVEHARNVALILERCPDQQWIDDWSPMIADLCKTSSVDPSPREDRVFFAIEDQDTLFSLLREHRLTLFEHDVWLMYGRYGEACLEALSELIMSRANGARRNELIMALWPVCSEKLVPLMLDASLKVDCAEAASWWLVRQGADATLGLMRQARRRGKVGHQARTMLERIVTEGHGEEVRALLARLDDAKLVQHIEETILATAPPLTTPDQRGTSSPEEEMRVFPAPLEALGRYPLHAASEGEASERAAFLDALTHTLHLERSPAIRAREGGAVLSQELLAQVCWCVALAWPLDRRKGKKGKARREREAMQAVLRDTLSRLREAFEPADLAAWTRHLLESWWAHGQPAEQMWCVRVLGYCGGEDEALWMREKMRTMGRWFPKSHLRQSTFDVMAALADMDSPMSRMMLDVLSEEGRSELICSSAHEAREALRTSHGWDEATWQDVSVPTAGLDERGKRDFDYGARRFELVFRGAFESFVLAEDGKVHARLPPARKSDDQGAVQDARRAYAEVNEQLAIVVERQRRRLEVCLCEQHSWTPEHWRARVAEHPLMRHFARMLVWKIARDEMVDGVMEERIEQCFLWTEEGEALGADYERLSWEAMVGEEEVCVRLVHPCDLDKGSLAMWSEMLTAFEVVQPIGQLGRSTQRLGADEEEALSVALRADNVWNITRRLGGWSGEYGEHYKGIVFWKDWGESWRVLWVHDETGWARAREKALLGAPAERPGLHFVGRDERVIEQGVCLPRARVPAWLEAEVRRSFEAVLG